MQQLFVGRQAIFDRRMRVRGYELLYREANGGFVSGMDGNKASASVILNAFIEMGVSRITGNQPAFLNLTRDFFTEMPPLPFDKKKMVLEILEDIEVDGEIVERISTLAEQGYRLALDDYRFEEKWTPLLPYVQIIKVDIPAVRITSMLPEITRLRRRGIRLLAEKVETREEHERLLGMGFDLFQGYYFSKPKVITARRLTENKLVTQRLLGRLSDDNVTIEELVHLITLDAGLSFKVLRYINSAALALRGRIQSISQAVVYLGLGRLRSWAMLIAMSGIENHSLEILNNALVRAHMCRALVASVDEEMREAGFSVGLLSVLDVLMDASMERILSEMPLSATLKAAILRKEGPCGEALECSLAYEELDWERARFRNLETAEIRAMSLTWLFP